MGNVLFSCDGYVVTLLILHINLRYNIHYSCVYGMKELYVFVLFVLSLSATSKMAWRQLSILGVMSQIFPLNCRRSGRNRMRKGEGWQNSGPCCAVRLDLTRRSVVTCHSKACTFIAFISFFFFSLSSWTWQEGQLLVLNWISAVYCVSTFDHSAGSMFKNN